MLKEACQHTEAFISQMPKARRKLYGQFFTSLETAQFMASLLTIPSEKAHLYVLDAGAGSGILSIALIEKCNRIIDKRTTVHLVCYENDSHILPLLKDNLGIAQKQCNFNLDFNIIEENYIVSQNDSFNCGMFGETRTKKYDIIIGNPPYKKIAKDAPEAKVMSQVCYGAPNLYFLFTAMGIHNLKDNSEMVYIIPRSWTSGAYFERFREYLFKHCILTYIHLFTSRNKVFDKENVLQETMIIRLVKKTEKPVLIKISTTDTNKDFSNIKLLEVPYNIVICGKSHYVHLVTDNSEIQSLSIINQFKNTLPSLGLKMRTGLVVDFRTRELLRNKEEENTIPLIYSQHIKNGRVRFPQGKENEYILKDKSGLIQKNKNYLFIKRFTAKEEHRRLQCGIYLKRYLPDFSFISSQNKVNFIDGLQEMSECIVYGLYVIFNSTLYDVYYRILNGSTQVNSTEINSMPIPSMQVIEAMGKQMIANKDLSESHCNQILNTFIHE